MPACRQCGRENPEGTAFCGFCATPLTAPAGGPAGLKPANPIPSSAIRGGGPTPPPPKPEIRTPTFSAPPPPPQKSKGGGGFEWIPWSELSSTQRIGRSVAIGVVGLVFIVLVRVLIGSLGGHGASSSAPAVDGSGAPITEGDRKDGIESLCKVFQIYGLPANDHDASEAAKNAGELFKLAGNQSPERSAYILGTIVGEFRSGKLGKSDCEAAGAPLPTHEDTLGGPSTDSNQNSNPQ